MLVVYGTVSAPFVKSSWTDRHKQTCRKWRKDAEAVKHVDQNCAPIYKNVQNLCREIAALPHHAPDKKDMYKSCLTELSKLDVAGMRPLATSNISKNLLQSLEEDINELEKASHSEAGVETFGAIPRHPESLN